MSRVVISGDERVEPMHSLFLLMEAAAGEPLAAPSPVGRKAARRTYICGTCYQRIEWSDGRPVNHQHQVVVVA